MLETTPEVQAVVDCLKGLQTPKAPRLLANEAKRTPLALSLAVKLTPMASADERRQLHRLLVLAWPMLADRPSLEQEWQQARTGGEHAGPFLKSLMRTLLGEDGTLQEQAARQVAEALSIDLLPTALGLLAEVVGTDREPTLSVGEIRMGPASVAVYGALWVFEGCHRVRQGDAVGGVKAFQQAAGHRRYAPTANLIAGRSLLRRGDRQLWSQAEALLLNGERAAVRDERRPLIEELINLYRMLGQADAAERWVRLLSEGIATVVTQPTVVAPPAPHAIKTMASYPALFTDSSPIVLKTSAGGPLVADEWIVTDFHCPEPRCACDKVFVRVEAAHHDCHGAFELPLGRGRPDAPLVVAGEPGCEHVRLIAEHLLPHLSGPNEAMFLRQRTGDVKALARAGRWELQQRLKSAEHLTRLDAELKTLTNSQPVALMPVTDWVALLRSAEVDTFTETKGWQRLLRARGFGMEPDPATGAAVLPLPEAIAVFRLPSRAEEYTASSSVWAAFVLVRLGMALIHELSLHPQEFVERLQASCHRLEGLTPEDRLRLQATCALHASYRPSSRSATRGLDRLTRAQRAEVGRGLVAVLHDRANRPEVVKRLGKLYAMLGLDPHAVFSDLHTAGTSTARVSQPDGLDLGLVQSRLSETRKVESLLDTIFAEDTLTAVPNAPSGGLDVSLRSFVERLLHHDTWARTDVVALAGTLDLMVDGAIDTINDTSLERFDELALEGDDPIYINLEIAAQLMA